MPHPTATSTGKRLKREGVPVPDGRTKVKQQQYRYFFDAVLWWDKVCTAVENGFWLVLALVRLTVR